MKKFLCTMLAFIMMLTAVCPVIAADISLESAQADTIIDIFETNMPNEWAKRIKIWKTFKAYMLDGTNGIDTVIKAINGEITLPVTSDHVDFTNVINVVKTQSEADKESLIFALNAYKAVPLEKRRASLNNFGDDSTPIVSTPLLLTVEETAAATALYDRHVGSEAQGKLSTHSLTPAIFMQLLTAFKGQFKMTNASDGGFVLASYDETFATSLASYIDAESINDVTVSTYPNSKAEGFDIICGIVDILSTFTADIDDLKIVLAHEDIDLYAEGLSAAKRPGSTTTEGITGGFGGNGYQKPEEQIKPESPFIDDSAFVIEEVAVPETAPIFPDTEDHWAEDYVRNLASRNIIFGDDDSMFRPDAGITRQEIAVMLVRGLGLEEEAAKYAQNDNGFNDNHNIADWAMGAVNLLVDMGIYTGYDDGEFKPEKIILRQELIAVLMRYADNTKNGLVNDYVDSHEIHGYAHDFVAHASDLGIIAGYPDGTFGPLKNITRAEAAKVLYGIFGYYDFLNK